MTWDIVRDVAPARNIPHRPRQHQAYTHFCRKKYDTNVAIIRPAGETAGNAALTCLDYRIGGDLWGLVPRPGRCQGGPRDR